jgi:type VI secretion system protein
VKDFDRLLPEQDASKVLETGSLSIGHGLENDWVLPDPERVISKQHCLIREDGGRYLLTDTSSNGVYLNAGPHRLRGQQRRVSALPGPSPLWPVRGLL